MLKNILSITGKSGLFKLVSRGNNMLIVESLLDGKRMPTYARDKIVSLADVSIFTTGDDIALWEVLEKVKKHENGKASTLDLKNADKQTLFDYMSAVLPEWDQDRVYPSDIRKLVQWYNILINANITDFKPIEEEKEDKQEVAS